MSVSAEWMPNVMLVLSCAVGSCKISIFENMRRIFLFGRREFLSASWRLYKGKYPHARHLREYEVTIFVENSNCCLLASSRTLASRFRIGEL